MQILIGSRAAVYIQRSNKQIKEQKNAQIFVYMQKK